MTFSETRSALLYRAKELDRGTGLWGKESKFGAYSRHIRVNLRQLEMSLEIAEAGSESLTEPSKTSNFNEVKAKIETAWENIDTS